MRRAGFTLVEIVVAVTLASILVLAMGLAVRTVITSLTQLDREGQAQAAESNGRRWLNELFANVEVDEVRELTFVGLSNFAQFHSWQWVSDGWRERVPVLVEQVDEQLLARIAGEPFVLMEGVQAMNLQYLERFSLGGQWLPVWDLTVTPPAAVRLLLYRTTSGEPVDTIVIVIGERG